MSYGNLLNNLNLRAHLRFKNCYKDAKEKFFNCFQYIIRHQKSTWKIVSYINQINGWIINKI